MVLDSKLEFIPEFYSPERGDKILSPKDVRCAYWDIGSEVTDEADAVSVMRALYPTHPNNPYAQFFDDQACKIAAYLLTYSDPRPSCGDYAYWLAHPEEIFKRVVGSEHEQTLSPKSPNMLNSILATLNTVGYALRMMSKDRNHRERFTVREWESWRLETMHLACQRRAGNAACRPRRRSIFQKLPRVRNGPQPPTGSLPPTPSRKNAVCRC